MAIFPIPMTAVAAFNAIAIVPVSFPILATAGPMSGVAFNSELPKPVIAAAFADTTFVAVPATAGTIYKSQRH